MKDVKAGHQRRYNTAMHARVPRPDAVARLIAVGDYAGLRAQLRGADPALLARLWPRLQPLHKLVAFKLMNAAAAMDFFKRLPYDERYFLFCGFAPVCIAPVLEGVPPGSRRLFVRLPAPFQKRMLDDLLREVPAR